MKKILNVLIIFLLIPGIVLGKEYDNKDSNFSFAIPDSYYVIDESNVEDNKAFIEHYGIFTNEVEDIFKESNELVIAIRSDELVVMHISSYEDKDSKRIWNLFTSSTNKHNKYKSSIKNKLSNIVEQEYKDKFLYTLIEEEDYTDVYYSTIYNGLNYEIKFTVYDTTNKEDSMKEIENIYQSFSFTKEIDKPLFGDISWFKVVLIVISLLALTGIGYELIKKNKKRKK